MHIFLTGEKQVGKSTLVRRVLESAGIPYGGLLSVSEIEDGIRRVYLRDIISEKEKKLCGICINHHITRKNPEVFDSFGVSLLERAVDKALVVIDEIGNMESSADKYSTCIANLIEREDILVFGVLQNMARTALSDYIRESKNVMLYEVTEKNRDNLVSVLSEKIKLFVNCQKSQ